MSLLIPPPGRGLELIGEGYPDSGDEQNITINIDWKGYTDFFGTYNLAIVASTALGSINPVVTTDVALATYNTTMQIQSGTTLVTQLDASNALLGRIPRQAIATGAKYTVGTLYGRAIDDFNLVYNVFFSHAGYNHLATTSQASMGWFNLSGGADISQIILNTSVAEDWSPNSAIFLYGLRKP